MKPEKSKGYDAGFEQALFDKRVQFGATYFHNDITNLITYEAIAPAYTTYVNLARAQIDGVETFLAVKPFSDLALRADYTYTMAMDAAASRGTPAQAKAQGKPDGQMAGR